MAGFGAGFGKALGGSLEAAGKLHQEEQLRSREYERAKTDRQAEIADTRSYNERIAAEDRARIAEKETHRYSKGPDGKFYYTTLDGTLVEKDPNSPGVKLYLEAEEKRGQEKTLFGLKVREAESGLAVNSAQIRNLNASALAAGRRGNGSDDSDKYASLSAFIESAAKNLEIRYAGGTVSTNKDGKRTYKEPSLGRTRQKDGTWKYDSPHVASVFQVLGNRYAGRPDMTIRKIAQTAQGGGEEATYAKETMLLLQPHLTFGVSSK